MPAADPAPAVAVLDVPALRFGVPYDSLQRADVKDFRTGEVLARVSQVNAGLIRRDLKKAPDAAAALRRLSCGELVATCARAADLFATGTVELAPGQTQSPQQYVELLSRTSGLPHVLVRRNMDKVRTVLAGMDGILRGLTRGLDLAVLDRGRGTQAGVPISYVALAQALGVVLPSNSPGVNSIWLPAVALRTPVVLKPGRDEPWTPLRLIAALTAAGCPREAFAFYPTDHEGADTILRTCPRAILFGDDRTLANYTALGTIEGHGTGRSKVILGPDAAPRWERHLDTLVASILDNGGRSCINASCVVTTSHADDLAAALADRLAAVAPRPAADHDAQLAAFTNPAVAAALNAALDAALATPGAEDLTHARRGPRLVEFQGATYLLPTLVRCQSIDHPLGNTEYLFPYASVVELPAAQLFDAIGPTLAATVLSDDAAFVARALACPHIDRLNLGPVPTSRVQWDQPHEGNLFEFLYRRRALQLP